MELHNRYAKSQRHLRMALLGLLREKPFREITVKDIVAQSELGRATFYLHYSDKEALLEEIIRDMANGLTSLMKSTYDNGLDALLDSVLEQNNPVFVQYFRYFRTNSQDFLVLLNPANGTDFERRFFAAMEWYMEFFNSQWIALRTNGPRPEFEVQLSIEESAIRALVNSLFQWVQSGMQPSEEIMATHHARMWVSYILMMKDTSGDAMYRRLLKRMEAKGMDLPE